MARQAMTKKIMVLGVDGMDARITKHLMDEGKMPNVKKFVDRGSCVKTCTCSVLSQPSPLHAGQRWLPALILAPTASPATGARAQKASMQSFTTWTAATAKRNRCGTLPPKLA